ncbi:hypothetical protein [Methylobacter tundripaludum]|uniref:Uncharacterized protein n=1 Tax=Methylobacter tundripaludum (strain ATCC BAA-1195 / DSM 17260 / SV96) TaxID=697282 RepID=G3IS16_METTV|nr:hypothetical protein [Methylobacter tundripaludum]EGW22227.1 hypothetical protein Mettu_1029 [Methylobacter tundripaludum SV96]
MKEREVMFTDIVSVLEFESYDKINRHLTLGWILLGVFSIQYSEHGYTSRYSIGWSRKNGDIKYPEKTQGELLLAEYENEDCPF